MSHETWSLLRWPAYNIVSIVCVLCAAYVAGKGKTGWGWFLFLAFMTGIVPQTH